MSSLLPYLFFLLDFNSNPKPDLSPTHFKFLTSTNQATQSIIDLCNFPFFVHFLYCNNLKILFFFFLMIFLVICVDFAESASCWLSILQACDYWWQWYTCVCLFLRFCWFVCFFCVILDLGLVYGLWGFLLFKRNFGPFLVVIDII